jgi:hypothetical protein
MTLVHCNTRKQCFIAAQRLHIVIAAVMGLVAIACGCARGQQEHAKQKEIVKENDKLIAGYLQGNVERARECLLKEVELLEEGAVLEASGRASLLSTTFYRLYALESRAGDEASAAGYLLKGRYWALRREEMAGLGTAKAMEQISKFSLEQVIEFVDRTDRTCNNGQQPAYLKIMRKITTQSGG